MKSVGVVLCSVGVMLFSLFIVNRAGANSQRENTGNVAEYLINQVRSSNLTFTRNGTEHSSQEAADHIRSKYEYFKNDIKTPEDFIHSCASQSILSGKPYLVSTPQGKVRVDEWLTGILAEYKRKR